ncbi:MAG: hypothetical protein HYV09_11805 [Deltaproteobacteria bacterium]|nr:hypothetical protein [Deltaproteobacteria bacterium]
MELLRDAFGVEVPEGARAALASETMRQVRPVELGADAVVLVQADRPALGIVVEVQLGPDEDKTYAWPCYLALLRRELRCPCVLVIVALDDNIARWCERAIAIGPPGFVLRPFVVDRSVVPRITEADAASPARGGNVELAVLSAVAHGEDDEALQIVVPALDAIARSGSLDDDRRRVYTDLVLAALGGAARAALEELMKQGRYEYQSEFAKRYVAEGRAEGHAEGMAEALLEILSARGIEVDAAVAERVRSCTDRSRLDAWIRRAAVATRLADVFDDG